MPYLPPMQLTNPYAYYQTPSPASQGCVDPCACKLKVEGKGSARVQPDTAAIVIGVLTEDRQLKSAQEENANKITAILSTLKRFGIPSRDIETQVYTIDPQYDYVDGKQVFRGYRVLHSLKITVRDVEKIGEIIDEAVESGANIVNRIDFTVSDPSRYYQQALKSAVDDASTKAATIGEKLKVDISRIPVQIIEERGSCDTAVQMTLAQTAAAPTPIQAGQVEITARIEAIFTYTR